MSSPNFIDYVKFYTRSGSGGAGCLHFYRDKRIVKGGPDGGNGGRGGHVILRGNKQYWTLLHLKYRKHVIAENGCPGAAQNCTGSGGKDVVLDVPLGTIARKEDVPGLLCEITRHGEEIILTPGGRGGKGNTFFANAVNQAPHHAQPGESGLAEWVILELKILADVGLIGFPNAGKSTLLSVVSAATPKIADYPFTTLTPALGMVAYHDGQSFVMADIPGLIEGAASGKGLGIRFLKHVERNAVLLVLIAADSPDVKKEYYMLLHELAQYNPTLLDKKRILAVSKSDMLDNELRAEIKKTIPANVSFVFISAITNSGIEQLKDIIWKKLR